METSVGVENTRVMGTFCPLLFPQRWLISHCAHEKASVHEWVNSVYYSLWCAFLKKIRVLCPQYGWEVEEGGYCYKISQRHENYLILNRIPGFEILRHGLAKEFIWVCCSILWKTSQEVFGHFCLTQCSGLNSKCHVHFTLSKSEQVLSSHMVIFSPWGPTLITVSSLGKKGSLQGEVISRRKTLVTGSLFWNFGLKSLCFMWLWNVIGTFSQWISYGENFGNISKSLTNEYNT